MAIIDVFSRRLTGYAVERGNIDGRVVCRMFNGATANQGLPKYLSTATLLSSDFIAGSPIFAYSKSRRSRRYRTPLFLIPSLNT